MQMKIIDPGSLDFKNLEERSRCFFSTVGTPMLLGPALFEGLDGGIGHNSFEHMISRCGYASDPVGFFKALFSRINSGGKEPVRIKGKKIPLLYIYDLLEAVLPGNRLHSVTSTDQLAETAFIRPEDATCLQEVMDRFPVRLSDHVIRQALVSEAVAKQYIPFAGELDGLGHEITFDGHFKNGVLEQMYKNRVIFLLDMRCPVYCRFCFRKHKSTRKEKTPSQADVAAAVEHVKIHPDIHEILITGGEPLWNRPNLDTALSGLRKIDHVNTIRIATRCVAYYPELFLEDKGRYIRYLIEQNHRCQAHGKRIEIGIHMVHPDEISLKSLEIISKLVENGIQVYVQTPFLNGLNTDGKVLARLFTLLRQAGAQIYYIFTPCHTIHGTKVYWSPIQDSFAAQSYLRQEVSDRCVPKLCTATALGKIEWHTSGWAVEQDEKDPEYTWIRTPYTLDYFKAFARDGKKGQGGKDEQVSGMLPTFRVNSEGTLDAKFRLKMGDDILLSGNRKKIKDSGQAEKRVLQAGDITSCYARLYDAPHLEQSISPVSSDRISLAHKTRLEIKVEGLESGLAYIREHPEITDAVLHWEADPEATLDAVGQAASRLKAIPHLQSLRLRSRVFCTAPQKFTGKVIEAISGWSEFSLGTPFRIEMESWFLLPEQVTPCHSSVAKRLINRGVNVYANSALIKGVNDTPSMITALAHALRRAKIEFHHLYVAGLSLQEDGLSAPDIAVVIDIASQVRAQCSGRQIPLYMVRTPAGEIDFGQDASFIPFSP